MKILGIVCLALYIIGFFGYQLCVFLLSRDLKKYVEKHMNNISYDEYRTPDDPTYNYNDVERIESSFARHFYRAMTELAATAKNVLYFHEENPTRVKTIIKTIALNPKLKSEFIREFDPARTAADTLAKE